MFLTFFAAFAIAISFFQLGALSVWVTVLSFAPQYNLAGCFRRCPLLQPALPVATVQRLTCQTPSCNSPF